MSECPKSPNQFNCGLVAAQRLVDQDLIVVDYTGGQALGEPGVCIDNRGLWCLDILTPQGVHSKGTSDIADFGCVACGKCVQIIDDFDTMSARIEATERT